MVGNGVPKTKPQNVWTHNRTLQDVAAPPTKPNVKQKNVWAAQPGQLAKTTSVLQDAWSKK